MNTRHREAIALILVILLVGGGIAIMQHGGMYSGDVISNASFDLSPARQSLRDLEQIARFAHDYLNGYLSGSGWGTVLPTELMKEEMERLQFEYELIDEMITNLYPLDNRYNQVLLQFYEGFNLASEGLKQNDMEILLQSHKIFHHIDYEVFHHKPKDDPVI